LIAKLPLPQLGPRVTLSKEQLGDVAACSSRGSPCNSHGLKGLRRDQVEQDYIRVNPEGLDPRSIAKARLYAGYIHLDCMDQIIHLRNHSPIERVERISQRRGVDIDAAEYTDRMLVDVYHLVGIDSIRDELDEQYRSEGSHWEIDSFLKRPLQVIILKAEFSREMVPDKRLTMRHISLGTKQQF
jgi:hypothetical protein